jgi:hypothetical protein
MRSPDGQIITCNALSTIHSSMCTQSIIPTTADEENAYSHSNYKVPENVRSSGGQTIASVAYSQPIMYTSITIHTTSATLTGSTHDAIPMYNPYRLSPPTTKIGSPNPSLLGHVSARNREQCLQKPQPTTTAVRTHEGESTNQPQGHGHPALHEPIHQVKTLKPIPP